MVVGGDSREVTYPQPKHPQGQPSWSTLALPTCVSLPFFLQGFEPRDTDIGRKLMVWRALQALTGPRKLLSFSPDLEQNR